MASRVILSSFPAEIQFQIIQQLDPIGLYSLSQSCVHFRTMVNPGRKERLEQLLALECQEEYGGMVAVYGIRHAFSRMYEVAELRGWENFRWTCSSCLRLLPHGHFAEEGIFRAAQRKPHPRFVNKNPQTSWGHRNEDGAGTDLSRTAPPSQDDDDRLQDEGQKSDDEYAMSYTKDYENEDEAAGDSEDYSSWVGAHRHCWGHSRHQRKCISCLYDNNPPVPEPVEWTLGIYGVETFAVTVPMVRTREINLLSLLERHFPGFLDSLAEEGEMSQSKRVTSYFHKSGWDDTSYDMVLLQCPRCRNWKEMRSMHIGGGVPWHGSWDLDAEDGMRNALHLRLKILEQNKSNFCCSACFVAEYGRDILGTILVPWFQALADEEIGQEMVRMCIGWQTIPRLMHKRTKGLPRGIRKKWKVEMDQLTDLFGDEFHLDEITPELAPKLKEQYLKMLPLVKVLKQRWEEDEIVGPHNFADWADCYLLMDESWTWLQRIKGLIKSDPEVLVDWVLKMDSHPFNILQL